MSISDVNEGMVAGNDITGPNGLCLVSRGTALTVSTIKSLKRNNITEISIEEDLKEDAFTEEKIKNAEKSCLIKTEEKFYSKPEDPMMKVIFKAALRSEALEYLKCKKAS